LTISNTGAGLFSSLGDDLTVGGQGLVSLVLQRKNCRTGLILTFSPCGKLTPKKRRELLGNFKSAGAITVLGPNRMVTGFFSLKEQ
jgi:hypothetical protein